MGNKRIKRVVAGLLAALMVFSLIACGKEANEDGKNGNGGGGGTQNAGGQTDDDSYVYAPKFYDLPCDASADTVWYSSVSFKGDRLYYICFAYHYGEGESVEWCYVDTANPEAEPVVVLDLKKYREWGETTSTNVGYASMCEDGGTVLLLQQSPVIPMDATAEEQARLTRAVVFSLKKIAADGTEVFTKDITEYLRTDKDADYLHEMFTDKEGNIYISNQTNCVWVFDKEGNHKTDIDLSNVQGYIAAVNILPDGRLGVLHQNNNTQLEAYDAATGKLVESYNNLPFNCNNAILGEGPGGGILLSGNGSLYEYSLEEKEYRELLKWMNCNISSDSIQQVKAIADGRIAAFSSDWIKDENSLIVMEKTSADKAEEKKVLTLACMSVSSILQSAVVEFNKTSSEYRIEIWNYGEGIDYSSESAYEDARTLFYNEILAGNVPDMFLAGDIDVRIFAEKELIEDLSPYLDGSTTVGREDLFESVLNAYTMNQTLCAIPVYFMVQTLAGRASEVGTESGWTLEEMIAYAKAHPETQIMPSATKVSVLSTCLLYDFGSWVDREAGECFFDTEEFKAVLEFANRYPAQAESGLPGERQQIIDRMALLYPLGLENARSWQFAVAMFHEPITAIGYPSSHANGVRAYGFDAVCISAASENKEAAWSFIETLLSEKVQEDERRWSFPVRVSTFEKELAELMEPQYMYDEKGEVLLDANGRPVERSSVVYRWSDGYEVSVYALTQEEAEGIRHVISQIDGVYEYDGGIMDIVLEETAPYFDGQKSVEEAADIIQSRVQLYLHEGR